MSGPANDNIASATSISGTSGSLASQTNVLATIETSEPGWNTYNPAVTLPASNAIIGPDATVWYVWVCPTFPTPSGTGAYGWTTPTTWEMLFSTSDPSTNFKSTVQVYTGTGTIASLAEVTGPVDERVGENNGLGNGANVSFIATTGTTYYIRVGGRQNAQGNFKLSWRMFDRPTLGSCSKCPPTSQGIQIGTVEIAQVYAGSPNMSNTQTVMTLPCGVFEVKYCKGSYIYNHMPTQYTVVASTAVDLMFAWPENSVDLGAAGAGASYPNPSQAFYGNLCLTTGQFVTGGGTLTMTNTDTFPQDNINGSPNPVFEVISHSTFQGTSQFTEQNSGSSLTGTNPTWSGTFVIQNNGIGTMSNVTVALLNIDGVSGASAAQTLNLAPGANSVTFTFTANITASLCTANLTLSNPCVANFATLEFPLYPVIVYGNYESAYTGNFSCPPSNPGAWMQYFRLQLVGFVTLAQMGVSSIGVTGASSNSLAQLFSSATCAVESSQLIPVVTFSGGIGSPLFSFLIPSPAQNTNVTMVPTVGSLTMPSIVVNVNIG